MERLNGHFSGWKRPSNWGPPGIDARTGFILCHDQWAEEGSKQWTLQFFTSFSEGPKLFWVVERWLNSKRTSKLSKQGENVAAELQRKQTWGKNNWNPNYMMFNLELVVTIWELLTLLWNHPLNCAAAAPNPPKYWAASVTTLRTGQSESLCRYMKRLWIHILNTVCSSGLCIWRRM